MVVQDRLNEQESQADARDAEQEIPLNTEEGATALASEGGVRYGSDGKPYSFNDLRENMASNTPKVSQAIPKYAVGDVPPFDIPRAPRAVERVVAMYGFDTHKPGHLPFNKGDVIEILSIFNKNWFEGRLNTQAGIFEANYMEVLPVPGRTEARENHSS